MKPRWGSLDKNKPPYWQNLPLLVKGSEEA